jgi:hypothetical protein
MARVTYAAAYGDDTHVAFHCPGCDETHYLRVRKEPRITPSWTFNGDFERPTFMPSVLVTYGGRDAGQTDADGFRSPPAVCHSFVTDGRIQFLADSTHALAGQTVDLPEIPSSQQGATE